MYVVCVCMYVVICKIHHCIHIHWCIPTLCPSPWKYIKVCGYSETFFAKKNLNQRSLTPRWPLTPHLLRSHVWLYPRIFVSKSHENTSKYVDTVNLFCKKKNLNQRSLTPRWPLTPHMLRSHVWLYPRIGTWTQWSLGRVTHVTSTDVGSKVI